MINKTKTNVQEISVQTGGVSKSITAEAKIHTELEPKEKTCHVSMSAIRVRTTPQKEHGCSSVSS